MACMPEDISRGVRFPLPLGVTEVLTQVSRLGGKHSYLLKDSADPD